MICPYCGYENDDSEEFCEECGRLIQTSQVVTKKEEDNQNTLTCKSMITIYDDLNDYVYFPIKQNFNGRDIELTFSTECENSSRLGDVLRDFDSLQKISALMIRILEIFGAISRKKLIVGTCDLNDFHIGNDGIENMKLMLSRPLFVKNERYHDIKFGEFASPEFRSEEYDLFSKQADVYIMGQIFNRLLIGEKYTAFDYESQIFWAYNGNSFMDNAHMYFHNWLGKCLNMYGAKRYKDIENCANGFRKACELEQQEVSDVFSVDDTLVTNVGSGKAKLMKDAGVKAEEWNQDSIAKWKDDSKGVCAYLLADGISNCSIGDGYTASNIVRDVFMKVLEEQDAFPDNSDSIQKIVERIVVESNKRIYEKAIQLSDKPMGIMGSTLVILLILGGKAYYYSMGDSKLFLIRNDNILLLNQEDNVGNDALRSGTTYSVYRQMEDKDSISVCIGGGYSGKGMDAYMPRKLNQINIINDDVFVLCSDGVMDYLVNNVYDSEWDKEQIMLRRIKNDRPLEMSANSIIKLDNENGGGDNLSIIIVKIGGKDNE